VRENMELKKIKGFLTSIFSVRKDKNMFQHYQEGKPLDSSKVAIFQNDYEVERFKLEEKIRRLDREIAVINKRLIPWENEMKKKHHELWNY
jgi:hypothetical protein